MPSSYTMHYRGAMVMPLDWPLGDLGSIKSQSPWLYFTFPYTNTFTYTEINDLHRPRDQGQNYVWVLNLVVLRACPSPQVPADHCGGGVRALLPPVPQGHPEGPGGDVPWSAASSARPVSQELPAAVHPQHLAWRRRASRVRPVSTATGTSCPNDSCFAPSWFTSLIQPG